MFALLAEIAKQTNPTQEYIVDSCPVPVCDNIRIFSCRLYQDRAFRGRVASKKRFVYGLRVHLLVTATGQPVECVLVPAAQSDLSALKSLALDLASGAEVYADPAYTDYTLEDSLQEVAGITLTVPRKNNSKRASGLGDLCL